MHKAHKEYFVTLKQRLEAAPQGQRGKLINDASAFLSRSPATVYRKLESIGWESGRKVRNDCGTMCIDQSLALTVGGILKSTTRANGKRTLPITTVVSILAENGMGIVNQETGEVTMPHASTVAKALKVYGCHPTQVAAGKPAQEMRSLHPNHVWQMDASTCVVFYLPGGKVAVMDERKYNERKPQNLAKLDKQKIRVVRWLITDHTSGSFYLEYTQGEEDAETAINVFINAMCKREGNDIMHGAPFILYTDPGSANRSAMMKGLCKQLGVQNIQHAAGNARATGQVESTQNLVETQFEGRLKLLNINSLDELNAHATAWRVMYHATAIHNRHKQTRHKMWMTINQNQLRVPASKEALKDIVGSPPKPCKVNAKLILNFTPKGYKGLTYSVSNIDGVSNGAYVGVSVNPYYSPAIDVIVKSHDGTERVYTVQPIERDKAGFAIDAPVFGEGYKAVADTITDTAVKAMDKQAYDAGTLEAVKQAKKQKQPVYQDINVMADVQAARQPTYMPTRGRELALETPRELPKLNHIEAAIRVRPYLEKVGIEWTSVHLDYIKATYPPDSVPVEDIENIASHLIAVATPQTTSHAPALKLVVCA